MLAASILLALLPTASAFSSAQYPAVSCSSCPAIPSNDRGWNSVRTSPGRGSRYSSIARCCALSATVVIAGRIMFSDARQLAHTHSCSRWKTNYWVLCGAATLQHDPCIAKLGMGTPAQGRVAASNTAQLLLLFALMQ